MLVLEHFKYHSKTCCIIEALSHSKTQMLYCQHEVYTIGHAKYL